MVSVCFQTETKVRMSKAEIMEAVDSPKGH